MAESVNRLLAVDDDPDICEFVTEVADGLGYTVDSTTDPQQLSAKLAAFRPTVIVMDLQMPGVDGIELLRELSRLGSRARILVVSGMDTRVLGTAERLGLSQGLTMLGSLQKPIMLADLEALLKQALLADRSIGEADLRAALEDRDIEVYYQPKVTRAAAGRWIIDGAEALARWHHADLGPVGPAEFVPLAERSGLIGELTDQVVATVLAQAAEWARGGLPLTLAVNLSARLLNDLDLPDRLAARLAQHGLPPNGLVVEVTESAAMADPQITMDILTRLRVKDIGLSIDDFGTGYSSLTQLYRMPFSELKIDTSFVLDLLDSEEARTMVDSMIYLAHKLGMSVCAEGVEGQAILDFLDSYGCDKAQGYFIGRPMPAAELPGCVRAWNGEQPEAGGGKA